MSWKKLARLEYLVLLLVVVAGVTTRLYSIANFIKPDGGFYFYNPDSYDHLRHIMLGVRQFPAITLYDKYVGYPVGTGHIWAPLYDYAFTAVAWLFGLNRAGIETLGFFSGPVLYGIGIVLIFLVARRLFASTPGACAAAFIFAFHPTLLSYSLPMNFDHHILEPIIGLLFIALPFLEKENSLTPWRGVLTAGLIVMSIFIWRGSTIFWAMTFAAIMLRTVAERNRNLAGAYAGVFLLAAAILALYCRFDPLELRRGVSLVLISWFHPLALLGCAAALFAFARLSGRILLRGILPTLLLGLLLLPFTPLAPIFARVREALQFMFGYGDPWLLSINELKNTLTTYGLLDGLQYLSVGYFLIPLAMFLTIRQWKRNRHDHPLALHFVAWCGLALLALVYRYALYSSVIVALTTAYLVSLVWSRVTSPRRLIYAMLLVTLSIGYSLGITAEALTARVGPAVRYGLFGPGGTLDWIKRNTPATSYYLTPDKTPEYGILADWDLGSYLYYGAERPSLATPFGWETHGFFEHAAFFATQSPPKALEIAAANRIRYVLVSWNRNKKTYYDIAKSGEMRRKIPVGTVSQKYIQLDSMYYRLLIQDGTGYAFSDAYRHALNSFRLVFESDYLGGEVPATGVMQSQYKLYEIVPGAKVIGKTAPDMQVAIALAYTSGRGRNIEYRDIQKADQKGEYAFTVPYATGSRQGDTLTAPNYEISIGREKVRYVRVTEEQVMNGFTIIVEK